MSTDTITVKVGGEDREVFASYGLMNALSRIVGDVERAPHILMNADLRDDVLVLVLAERTKSGKIIKKVELDDLDLTTDEARTILEWAVDRYLNFTLPFANSAVQKMVEVKPQIESMAKSMSS